MQEHADTHQLDPAHQVLCQPAHQHWCQRGRAHKAHIDHGSLVAAVAQLGGAEEDHVAHDAEEGEPLAQLHQQHTNSLVQLLLSLRHEFPSTVTPPRPLLLVSHVVQKSLLLRVAPACIRHACLVFILEWSSWSYRYTLLCSSAVISRLVRLSL